MNYHKITLEKLRTVDVADVLLVTATKAETEILHSKLGPLSDYGIVQISANNRDYFLGKLAGYNIIHCQCKNMGTQGEGSSILTTTEALKQWPNIKCVIMVGIAFGMYDKDEKRPQHYSDVLVAEKIYPYENQRYNNDGTVIYRGVVTESNVNLVDAFTIVSRKWSRKNIYGEDTKIDICCMLTGEKLVDDKKRRDELKEAFPEYRGGEMEGIGIASACNLAKKPWIVLKGICDFADGNKSEHKEEKQKDAALASVHACELAFETDSFHNLIGNRNQYYYRDYELEYEKVFFIHYDEGCEPYYINRRVDIEWSPYILNKNLWVFGKSGMGKSDFLTRNVIINKVEYLSIDLSLIDKSDSNDAIIAIYQEICDYTDTEPQILNSYKDLIIGIAKLLNNKFQNSKVYLLIDEIPFNSKELFSSFVDKICTLIQYIGRYYKSLKVVFMLSSINSPLDYLDPSDSIEKIKQHIKFIGFGKWTFEECTELINCICKAVGLKIADGYINQFIEEMGFSPRSIKNTLQEACAVLGVGEVNAEVVNKIKSI
jgi:nucleoside phosphorylase